MSTITCESCYVRNLTLLQTVDSVPTTPGLVNTAPTTAARAELPGDDRMPLKTIAHLTITEEPIEVNGSKHYGGT